MSGSTYKVTVNFLGGAKLELAECDSHQAGLDYIRKQIEFLRAEHTAHRTGFTFSATIRGSNTVSVLRNNPGNSRFNPELKCGLYAVFTVVEVPSVHQQIAEQADNALAQHLEEYGTVPA